MREHDEPSVAPGVRILTNIVRSRVYVGGPSLLNAQGSGINRCTSYNRLDGLRDVDKWPSGRLVP
jgi:hypothetical protein